MFNSLKRKITLGFVLITVISSIAFFALSFIELRKAIEAQTENSAAIIAEQIKISISGYSTDEVSAIQGIVGKYKTDNIDYVSVKNKIQRVIAHTNSEKVGSTDTESRVEQVLNNNKHVSYMEISEKGYPVYNVIMPLEKEAELVGVISIGIPLRDMKKIINDSTIKILIVTALILGISTILGLLISKNIVKPVNLLMDTLGKVSQGNFTVDLKIDTKDEIGKLSNMMELTMKILRGMIGDIKKTTDTLGVLSEGLSSSSQQLAASSEQVAASVQDTAEGASNQAKNIDETIELLEGFENTLNEMEIKLGEVSKGSEKIKYRADLGAAKIDELVTSIKDVDNTFKNVEDKVIGLNISVEKITSITDVINNVAEQTNLLALNAAIEAARAGEVGRGFAVVSEEIRKLAEQVLQSSKDIANIVKEITQETKQVSDSALSVADKIDVQKVALEDTVTSLEGIIAEVDVIAPMLKDSYDSLENTIGSKNIIMKKIEAVATVATRVSNASEEIAATVEEQTASTEEFTVTAQELDNISRTLKDNVSRFII